MKVSTTALVLVFIVGCSRPLDSRQIDKVFGWNGAFDCVQAPDRVEAWRIEWRQDKKHSLVQTNLDNYVRLSEPVDVAPAVARRIAEVLNRQSTYSWNSVNKCQFLPGVQLRFAKGDQIVDILLCFKCKELWVWQNQKHVGGEEFDNAKHDLAKLVKQIFPDDKVIQSL